MNNFKCLLLILVTTFSISISGQDLTQIGKEKIFKINGGLGLNYTSTFTNDSNRIPMPTFWGANLNLNLSIYGLSFPISAMITNGKVNFTHAFNQFGISPHYKWLTLHAGYRQYQYSPFTVSGQTFFGGGIELRPAFLRLGFFTGRLRKATELDSAMMFQQTIPGSYPLNIVSENGTNFYSAQQAFSRKGWGAKIGFGSETNYVDFIVFKGRDDYQSITKTTNLSIKPEENLILGINIFQRMFKHFTFGLNGAASVYTYDTNAAELAESIPLLGLINKIFVLRPTTQFQWAGEVNFNINYPNFSLLSTYKRTQPNFQSMGINSFLSDLNLITFQPSWSLFKQKVRFNNMIQFQNDNLNGYKQFTTKRFMLNSSVSLNLTNRFGIDFNYNQNALNQTKLGTLMLDSVQASQLSNSFMVSPHLFLNNSRVSDIISVVSSFTNMKNKQKGISNDINNIYGTINNTLIIFKGGWNINTGLNYNSAITSTNNLQSYGFIAGLSKGLFDNKFSISNNNTILWNKLDGADNGNTVSIDLNAVCNLFTKHTLSVGLNYLYSPANGIYNLHDFQQTRFMISYQYIF